MYITDAGIFILQETVKFYNDLDDPFWRFTDNRVIHTAYKVSVTASFMFASVVYFTYKTIITPSPKVHEMLGDYVGINHSIHLQTVSREA